MVEYSDVFNAALGYVSDATKGANSIAALFSGLSKAKGASKDFLGSIERKKQDIITNPNLKEIIAGSSNSILDIKSVTGVLAPIMDFKQSVESDFKKTSERIKEDVFSSTILQSPESSFIKANSREWLTYGCSLQSSINDRIQILSLIDTEEANSIPVLVSERFFKNSLSFEQLNFGITASLTGVLIPLANDSVVALLGARKVQLLQLSGHTKVMIPDPELITDLNLDFSFSPGALVSSDSAFFLGYLWVVYMNVHNNHTVPIYEYGNLADKNSFIILSEKLIHQVEFFKKRIWRESHRPPSDRIYQPFLAYNDELLTRIKHFFQEDPPFESRLDFLTECRHETFSELFS
ncbi:hypothetical protein [Pseudoalteromonas maricaloris]|uniref:hypothetical protein n=1 Tax=Pseudoalteromonas maricaloris TaxID=184924 RepID=UPI003C2A273D